MQFQRATHDGDWYLYLASLEKLCVSIFAYNRQDCTEYIACMHELETTNADIWQDFLNGDFTVNTSNTVPFTRIGIDQVQEHLNKRTKGQGEISGIASYASTLLKFCLTAPELARIAEETEELINVSDCTAHHGLSQAKVARQELAITKLKTVLAPCNYAENDTTSGHMFKLISKEIISQNVQESILSTEIFGKDAYTKFVEERLVGDRNLWDKMTKMKLLTCVMNSPQEGLPDMD